MADHGFVGQQSVSEIYVRYYYKPLANYAWGWEKHLTFNQACGLSAGCGGIKFGNLHLRGAQSGNRPTTVEMSYQIVNAIEDNHRRQNQGNTLDFTGGNWYFIEIHIKLESPGQSNGLLEVWIDNCGANGLGCTGTPTLRMRHTNVHFGREAQNELIGTVWFENWGNLGSMGEAYRDQVKVSKVGPIGFASVGAPTTPVAPTNLIVTP
jgi:hypothetical protein